MDGNRRYEVVTSCDHLHGSHASYSDRTQMLGHNTSLYADIWMRDKMFSATQFMECQMDSYMPAFFTGLFVFFRQVAALFSQSVFVFS